MDGRTGGWAVGWLPPLGAMLFGANTVKLPSSSVVCVRFSSIFVISLFVRCFSFYMSPFFCFCFWFFLQFFFRSSSRSPLEPGTLHSIHIPYKVCFYFRVRLSQHGWSSAFRSREQKGDTSQLMSLAEADGRWQRSTAMDLQHFLAIVFLLLSFLFSSTTPMHSVHPTRWLQLARIIFHLIDLVHTQHTHTHGIHVSQSSVSPKTTADTNEAAAAALVEGAVSSEKK